MRRLTADQRAILQEQEDAKYEELFDAELDRQRAEWEEEFGAANPAFPFRANQIKAHCKAEAEIERIKRERNDD